MLTNADITLYHKRYDPTTRLDAWHSTVYCNVNWNAKSAVATGANGLSEASTVTVRIPTMDGIEAKPGDKMQRGIATGATPPETAFTVVSVTDNRRGSAAMQHFKIEGK